MRISNPLRWDITPQTVKETYKGSRMGHSVKASLWCVILLIDTRFRFFFRTSNLLRASDVTLRQRASK